MLPILPKTYQKMIRQRTLTISEETAQRPQRVPQTPLEFERPIRGNVHEKTRNLSIHFNVFSLSHTSVSQEALRGPSMLQDS